MSETQNIVTLYQGFRFISNDLEENWKIINSANSSEEVTLEKF